MLAEDPTTNTATLKQLSAVPWVFVRAAVASNPSTPSEVLFELAQQELESSNDYRVAIGLVENPSLPAEIYGALVSEFLSKADELSPREFYPNRLVHALGRSKVGSLESWKQMVDPGMSPKWVRRILVNEESSRGVLELLKADPSTKIAAKARKLIEKIY